MEWAIAVSRLRFAAKVSRRPRDFVTALLQGEGGKKWRAGVSAACMALWQLLPTKLSSMPCPATSMAAWEEFWTAFPMEWAGLLALALKTAALDPWKADAALDGTGMTRWTVEQGEQEDPDCFMCGHCDRWFATPGGATQHRIRAHGVGVRTDLARACCVSQVCPACGADFRSRIRVLRHLAHGAADCMAACIGGSLPRHTEEEIAAADERDRLERAAKRKRGLRDVAGLPFVRPPPDGLAVIAQAPP